MGDKIESKLLAKKAKVNTIPGFDGVVKVRKHFTLLFIAHVLRSNILSKVYDKMQLLLFKIYMYRLKIIHVVYTCII